MGYSGLTSLALPSRREPELLGRYPVWYAEQFAAIPAPYRIMKCPELQQAARVLGQRLLAA
jgi:hypothetical protein